MTESSEENFLRLEEQDLRILKNVITNPLIGIEFANTYDDSLFLGDTRPFAKSALAYIKAYKAPPTKRVMLEHVEDKERKEQVSVIWDSVMAMDSQASEFKYDLDKIKNRFGQQKVESIKEYLNNSSNQDELLTYLSKQVQEIKRIRLGQKQAYMQKTLKMYMPEFKQLYHSKVLNKDIGRGILTGYSFFDYVKNGMQPAELLIIGGESGAGKMLPLTTSIPTPNGFKKMEDIHPGDLIFGRDGKPHTVLAESEVVTDEGWKFIFNDGTEIISHDDHLWLSLTKKELHCGLSGKIRSTKEIVETLTIELDNDYGDLFSSHNQYIPVTSALELPSKNLPQDPYELGCSLFSEEINQNISEDYLWSSIEQRQKLLSGIRKYSKYDQDDCFVVQLFNSNLDFLKQLSLLANSLGYVCFILDPSKIVIDTKVQTRFITKAIRTELIAMKCIQVSSPDNLYLAGEQLVPTHNSMLLNNMAIQMWLQKNQVESTNFTKGYNVLYFSLEMPYEGCARRTLARLADVSTYALRDASLKKFELEALSKVTDFIDRYPYEFEIVDIPRGVTPEQIELRFQEACSRYHPDIVVVDYLGLLEDPDADGDDWLKLGYIAGKLHEIARVHNIAMLTAVQLNRVNNKGKEASNIIGMHRIGRSSLIMHHANVAIQIESRPDEHTYADMRYHVIKNREGELGMHVLMKNFAHATIKDMDPPFVPQKHDLGSNLIIDDDISGLLAKYKWGKIN